jgi:hypothetical protein
LGGAQAPPKLLLSPARHGLTSTETVLAKQTFYRDVTGSDGTISGRLWYTLREDFELPPGEWTLSVLHGTSVLVEKRFTVAQSRSAALKEK